MGVPMGCWYLQSLAILKEVLQINTSSQSSLWPVFWSCFFQVPDHSTKPMVTVMNPFRSIILVLFRPIQTSFVVLFPRRIFLHCLTSGSPPSDAVHLGVVPACFAGSSVKQAQVFSPSVNWSSGALQVGIGTDCGRGGNATGVGIAGVWATSCNLLWTWVNSVSYIPYLFDNRLLLFMPYPMARYPLHDGKSGYIVTWCPIIRHSAFTMPSSKPELFLKSGVLNIIDKFLESATLSEMTYNKTSFTIG